MITEQRIAILATTGAYHHDIAEAREQLEKKGIRTFMLSNSAHEIKTWSGDSWASRIRVDGLISNEDPNEFDGLIIPGGIIHADELQMDPHVRIFIIQMHECNKPIGAIGHGVQLLLDEGIVDGATIACPVTLESEARLAGAITSNSRICSNAGLVTCKSESDADAFIQSFIEMIVSGIKAETLKEL